MGRTLTVPGRSVLPQSAGPAFNSTSAPLEAFGGSSRGLLQAGQQLGQIGDEMAAEALRIQQDENERASKNLDIMYGEAIRKIQFGDGQNKGYFSEMGEDALTNFGAASEALDKELQTIMESTDNKRAVELFRRAADTRKLAALNSMSRHREQQQKVAAIATSEARVNSAVQDAAANWRDTKAIGLARATIMSEVMDQAEAQGWTPEIARDKLSTALSSMHEAAVMNAFRTDPIEAQLYYTTHLDDINGTTRTKIETLLEDGVMRTRSQELADDYVANYETEAEAIAAAKKDLQGKIEDETLDRISQFFSMKDRELGREIAAINAANAREDRALRIEKRQAEAAAPELAANIVDLHETETAAIAAAREQYDGVTYDAVEAQIKSLFGAESRDTARANQIEAQRRAAIIFQQQQDDRALVEATRVAKEQAPKLAKELLDVFDGSETEALDAARDVYTGVTYDAIEDQIKTQAAAAEREETKTDKKTVAQAALFAAGIMEQDLTETQALEKISELFSGPMYDAVSAKVRERFAAQRRDRVQALNDARSSAFKAIYSGTSPDVWAKANPEVYSLLSEEKGAVADLQSAWRGFVEGRIYATATDGKTLPDLRALEPEELAKIDLETVKHKLTKAEYEEAVRRKDAAENKIQREKYNRQAYTDIRQAISAFAPKKIVNRREVDVLSAQTLADIESRLGMYVEEFYTDQKKYPTTAQIRQEAQRLLLPITYDPGGLAGFFGVGDIEFSDGKTAATVKEITPEQKAGARVPYDKIPEVILDQAAERARKNNIVPDEDWYEQFVGATVMKDLPRMRRLLGQREGE